MNTNMPSLSREEFNIFVENIPIGEESKKLIKESSKCLYDFNDFLCAKFNASFALANAISDVNMKVMMKEYIEKNADVMDGNEEDVYQMVALITSEYAKKMGFPEYEKLGETTIEIVKELQKVI